MKAGPTWMGLYGRERVTRQLREAATTVEIDLLDHVILGRPTADPAAVGHYSFRAAGLL